MSQVPELGQVANDARAAGNGAWRQLRDRAIKFLSVECDRRRLHLSTSQRAHRNLAGYGPLEPLLLDDDKAIWEDTEDNTNDKVAEIGE